MLPIPEVDFKRTPVTLIIMAVAVALEIVCTIDPERRDFYYMSWKLGILSPVWSGELWRPFTSTLLHGNFLHLAFNAYGMLIFGFVLEPRFGSWRFLGLLVLLGSVSNMLPFLVNNLDTPLDGQVGCVGLSGILFGLFGMMWVGRRWRPEFAVVCNDDMVRLLVGWFFFCIVLTYLEVLNIANLAHATGLAFGAMYGMALYSPRHRKRWAMLSAVASLGVLATVIACPGHPLYERHRENERIRQFKFELEPRQRPPADGQQGKRPAGSTASGGTETSGRRPRLTSYPATASTGWPPAWGCRSARCAAPACPGS